LCTIRGTGGSTTPFLVSLREFFRELLRIARKTQGNGRGIAMKPYLKEI